MPEGESFTKRPRGPKAIILGHGSRDHEGGFLGPAWRVAFSLRRAGGFPHADSGAAVSPSAARLGDPRSGSGGKRDLRAARVSGPDLAMHQ
jgi:hypothetical protein